MELKLNSWYSNIYQTFYWTEKLPSSLCKFFWKELLAIIFLPIWWQTLVVNYLNKDKYDHIPALMIILVNILAVGITACMISNNFKGIFLAINLLLPILGYLVILLLVVLGFIIYKITEFIGNKQRKVNLPDTNWFTEGIKSFFNKYCPKITWK